MPANRAAKCRFGGAGVSEIGHPACSRVDGPLVTRSPFCHFDSERLGRRSPFCHSGSEPFAARKALWGQLRALRHLRHRGRSLLSQTKAFATSSGASLLGAPYHPHDQRQGYRIFGSEASDRELYPDPNGKDLLFSQFRHNQVFAAKRFPELIRELWKSHRDRRRPGAIVRQELEVVDNSWYGVRGGRKGARDGAARERLEGSLKNFPSRGLTTHALARLLAACPRLERRWRATSSSVPAGCRGSKGLPGRIPKPGDQGTGPASSEISHEGRSREGRRTPDGGRSWPRRFYHAHDGTYAIVKLWWS